MDPYKLKTNFMELAFVNYIPNEVEEEWSDVNGNIVILISRTSPEDETEMGSMYKAIKEKKRGLTYFNDQLYYIVREQDDIDNVYVLYKIINDETNDIDICDGENVPGDVMWSLMNADLVFSDDYLTSAPRWVDDQTENFD